MNTPYGFGITLPVPYEEAIPRVKEALKAEEWGRASSSGGRLHRAGPVAGRIPWIPQKNSPKRMPSLSR
jgi:hypothetical protein